MNNNQLNFNPTTGEPINNVNTNAMPNINHQQMQTQPTVGQQTVPNQGSAQPLASPLQTPTMENIKQDNQNINIQQQMQSIPTVDQNAQQFINNTQASNTVKKEEKKDGPNIVFIVILFIIIFAAIFFLFPYLLNILG